MVFAIVGDKKGRSREGSRIAELLQNCPIIFLALRLGVRAGGSGGFAKTARSALGDTACQSTKSIADIGTRSIHVDFCNSSRGISPTGKYELPTYCTSNLDRRFHASKIISLAADDDARCVCALQE